jgi:ketosteroid isomerase-like protein
MYQDGDYFITMDCQMYDNRVNAWADAWTSREFVKKRIEVGMTYCAWSRNSKNKNHISCCFKFNTKDDMENHESNVKEIIKDKKHIWDTMGDLTTLEKNKWKILKECMIDKDMLGVLDQTDDTFWFAKHKVDDKKKWVEAAVAATEMGAWNSVRWWGLMENIDNPEEVACCIRIPKNHLTEVLKNCWEGVGSWRSMMAIDVNTIDLRFYDVQYETMYNKISQMPDEVWDALCKRTGHHVLSKLEDCCCKNTKTLKKMHQLWAEGKVEELMKDFTDDATLVHHGDSSIPFLKSFNGKQGITEWIKLYADEIDHVTPPVMSDYASGDNVVYHQYSARVKVKKTGNEVDLISLNKVTFNQSGKVVDMVFTGNTNDLLTAYAANDASD